MSDKKNRTNNRRRGPQATRKDDYQGSFKNKLVGLLVVAAAAFGTSAILDNGDDNELSSTNQPEDHEVTVTFNNAAKPDQPAQQSKHKVVLDKHPIESLALAAAFKDTQSPPISSNYGDLIPNEVAMALHQATKSSIIPYDLMERMAFVESSFNPDAKNKKSNACGLMQITPPTQLELLYKHKNKLPPEAKETASHVERYTKSKDKKGRAILGYRVKDKEHKEEVSSLCEDPESSAVLTREYLATNVRKLEKGLGHTLNYTDAYFSHFLGARGAGRFLNAYYLHDGKYHHHRATDYASKSAVADNPMIFYRDGDKSKPRRVDEVYDSIAKKMTTTALPSFTGVGKQKELAHVKKPGV